MFLKVQQNELKVSNPNSVKGLTAGYILLKNQAAFQKVCTHGVSQQNSLSPLTITRQG